MNPPPLCESCRLRPAVAKAQPGGTETFTVCNDCLQDEAEQVDHPQHYNTHPSGIECIEVVEHMGFNLGNAIKYIWRADEKGKAVEDLKKASWYVTREIQKREREQ